ncbi:collagen binding domain-containing protein [Anaeromyxobacter sp. Fw109-5]|uniref:MSCRAMM family protein n=1 Tax=Anaeromyxobacter sp. (strain Fw109-5) TaxID=404589 RepID=UPI0013052C8D|nr:carboxypeptidase-like regulatory domain-containing protein [Anaeromyxobacter sp. Fw109-5]
MYSISGTVRGGAGFTISLSGTATRSTTTDANGNYSFSGLANGSYTVTPSDSAYAFSPPSSDISITSANVTGQDFTAYASAMYSISGTVRGGAGFTISLSGTATRSTTTDANGNYSFSGLANGSYTVTPSDSAYAFSPPSSDISITSANVTGQDFTAYASARYWDGCTPDACGPAMGAPNYLCTDGTIGGPGPCKRGEGGDCGWSYRSCPTVTLCAGCVLLGYSATACEPPQAGVSGPSGQCVAGPDDTCSELLLQCFTP